MSLETKTALDAAIDAHFADETDGALVSGYILQLFGSSFDDLDQGQVSVLREVAEGQNFITSLGIADYISQTIRHTVTETVYFGDDEDD
ncbi:hypothetical protein [Agromyces cerinus]|uniref:Uncharacterized protein n=1 Tax=Agromyces cerinus subsp. cerinus TaxID=232089 RepID=A0A1N6DPJ8_9MICO|nr:hypothetical protein [Agromyces cerinus]SIN72722.1 hypothetical protein SAMN05443544_0565 [Agromyces cerinus subsp. cerinus]